MGGDVILPFRKFFFWSHLIIGVIAGIFIFVKAVTGTLLMYEPQLVEWAEKDVRLVTPPSDGSLKLPLSLLVEKAQETQSAKKIGFISIQSAAEGTTVINFGREGGTFYFNPYTGERLGKGSKVHDAMHLIEDVHRWFWFRPIGQPISSAITLGFFLLTLSGLYIWWPKTLSRSKFKSIMQFKKGLTGKARDFNWHNVIGFWTSLILMVISLTGVIIGYKWANDLLFRLAGSEPPPAQQRQMGAGGGQRGDQKEEMPTLDLDALWAKASTQVPVWVSINLRLPNKPGAPVNVNITESKPSVGILVRSQLTLDSKTAEVTKWEPFSEASRGRRWRVWVRYLHTGEAGGWLGQLIAGLAAAGAAVLVWTGIALSWRRFRSWRAERKAQSV